MTSTTKKVLVGAGLLAALLYWKARGKGRQCTADINDPTSTVCAEGDSALDGAKDAVDTLFEFFTLGGHASVTTELDAGGRPVSEAGAVAPTKPEGVFDALGGALAAVRDSELVRGVRDAFRDLSIVNDDHDPADPWGGAQFRETVH